MMMTKFNLVGRRGVCSRIHPLVPRFFSASISRNPYLKTPKFVVSDYLIASFGFSPDKAATVSRTISNLKSPENPDSVRRLFIDHGFSEADITWRPGLLSLSPKKTLDPKLRTLRAMGLSDSALNQIILSGPNALLLYSAVSRITFWIDFLGGDEALLVKAFTYNRSLVNHDICHRIVPKISLLQSHGFSTQEIRKIVCTIPHFITGRVGWMEDLLKRTKELGFQPGSGMFLQGLFAMVAVTRETLRKKMKFLMSFGWSEDDFFSALRRDPGFLRLSEKNLQEKMEFLIGEAKCGLSYVASHPLLLKLSLEKRLRPRNRVLHLLETEGLCQKHRVLYNAICISNSDFAGKYILPYKETMPELHEEFLSACASGSG